MAGLGLLGVVLALALLSPRFAWETLQASRPSLLAAGLLSGAGCLAALTWWAVGTLAPSRRRVAVLVALGAALRLAMLGAEPIWEDDFYRYFWDGAQVAHGRNPYSYTPQEALGGGERLAPARLRLLALEARGSVERVNHPQLASVYPPAAQAAFALSYWLSPYDLTVWRLLLLGCESVSLWLLLGLLKRLGLSPFWAALYWLNPLVAKEMLNSAHVDALLPPLLLAAARASVRGRPVVGGAWLGLAAGVKLWPVLLVPAVIRSAWGQGHAPSPRWLLAAFLPAGMLCLWLAPLLAPAAGDASGLVAYAETWTRNALLFPLLAEALQGLGAEGDRLARLAIAALIGGGALWAARRALHGEDDLARRLFLTAMLWFALWPAQYPWYAMAFLPLAGLARAPWTAAALTILLPAYYAAKGLAARGHGDWAAVAPWIEHPAMLAAVWWDARTWRRRVVPLTAA